MSLFNILHTDERSPITRKKINILRDLLGKFEDTQRLVWLAHRQIILGKASKSIEEA